MFYKWEQVSKEQVIDILTDLKVLFADPSKWITWPQALNDQDNEVNPTDPKAQKWCLMGAGTKFTNEKHPQPLADFVECATRDYLNDISSLSLVKGNMSYEDEYALICLGLELLLKEKEIK